MSFPLTAGRRLWLDLLPGDSAETRTARHHQALRRPGGQRPHRPDRRARRGARAARRERRGQVDPDEPALRPAAAGRGRDPGGRRAADLPQPPGRHRGRHRHGAPALHAGAGLHGRGEHRARRRGDQGRPARLAGPPPRPPRRPGDLRALRPAGRPGRPGGEPAGRRAAAGGDRQGAHPRRRPADPGRADRGAHPAGDRRAARGHALAVRHRQVDRLHHPQAQRGQGHRRPDHGDPARPHSRRRHPGHPGGRAGRADGRPVGQPRGGEDPGRAGPRGAQGRPA